MAIRAPDGANKNHQEVFKREAAGCWFSCEPDGDALTTGPWLAKHTQNKVSKIVLSCLWC